MRVYCVTPTAQQWLLFMLVCKAYAAAAAAPEDDQEIVFGMAMQEWEEAILKNGKI